MTEPTEQRPGETVIWDGTGNWREAQPVVEWLKANDVESSEIPLHSWVSVQDGQIHFTRMLVTLDNKVRVTEHGEPAVEAVSAPLLVAWPLAVTA